MTSIPKLTRYQRDFLAACPSHSSRGAYAKAMDAANKLAALGLITITAGQSDMLFFRLTPDGQRVRDALRAGGAP